jgi:hypothetical protein
MLKKSSLRSQLGSEGLKDAVESSYQRKDSFNFKGIFDPEKVKGMAFWKPGAGQHIFDILPYLAGSQNPNRKKGKPAYIVDVFVHRNVGPNEDQYICRAKTFNEACPICEYRKEREDERKAGGDVSEEEVKALKPGRRAIYAIWDGDDQKKGVQIYEVAHWFMENPIQSIVKKPKRGGGLSEAVDFPHPDDGKSIAFEIKAVGKNRDYTGHQFVDRDEVIPDEILEAVPVVDELLHIPSYDEVHAAFFGASASEVEEIAGQVEEEPEPEPKVEEDVEEPEVEEPEPEPKPEPEPEVKAKPKAKVVAKEEEIPECPYAEFGSRYGENFDDYNECNECELRTSCEEMSKTGKETEPEPEVKKGNKFRPIPKKG